MQWKASDPNPRVGVDTRPEMAIGAALTWERCWLRRPRSSPGEDTYQVSSLGAWRPARRVRVGVSDPSLTAVSGMAAVSELCERLGVVTALEAAVGPIKQRGRGLGAGEVLVGSRQHDWPGRISGRVGSASC